MVVVIISMYILAMYDCVVTILEMSAIYIVWVDFCIIHVYVVRCKQCVGVNIHIYIVLCLSLLCGGDHIYV